ncbi:hypothetical protein PsorP6_000606 [Peronosclerospora sorghi]|uniref:Uncharacterized protein n=1 Tax=Peronosclerospora sorghi TaxID=230839 RepID=A0ACC0WTU1_9STRA|nr:hypothetical protein PsorP6_000606 [Peronosclerospora sorghi]
MLMDMTNLLMKTHCLARVPSTDLSTTFDQNLLLIQSSHPQVIAFDEENTRKVAQNLSTPRPDHQKTSEESIT